MLNKLENAVNPISNMELDWRHFCDKKSKDQFFDRSMEYCSDTNVC